MAEETGAAGDDAVIATLRGWIDQDRKHTALKALQGMIWRDGYRQGAYTTHVYNDAAANRTYRDVGLLGGTGRSCAPGTRPATRCTLLVRLGRGTTAASVPKIGQVSLWIKRMWKNATADIGSREHASRLIRLCMPFTSLVP